MSLFEAKERELALVLEVRDARERALRLEIEALKREAEHARELESQRISLHTAHALELQALRSSLNTAHARDLEAQRISLGTVQGAVERALTQERERLAAQAAAATYQQHQRSLWLRSPDCLLQVLCLVAMSGHCARNFSSLTRAFRGDVVLWGCIKERRAGFLNGTALMACSLAGDHTRARWLLERGASVDAQAWADYTSLILASFKGHLGVVRELLGGGASVHAAQVNGCTSLMRACQKGHLEVARLLLAHHASKAAVDENGCTAYDNTPAAHAELRALVKP